MGEVRRKDGKREKYRGERYFREVDFERPGEYNLLRKQRSPSEQKGEPRGGARVKNQKNFEQEKKESKNKSMIGVKD